MRKIIFLIAILSVSCSSILKAQDELLPRGKEKIRAAKVGLITNRLNLSEEQAKTFWIIYEDFDKKRSDIRRTIRQMTSESRNITTSDDKILSDLKELLNLKQKEVDLEKDYLPKFLKSINVRQLSELHKTEQLFNQMLVKKLNRADGKMGKEE